MLRMIIQGMTKFSQSDKKISQNFDKNNKIDCLFLFEIIKKKLIVYPVTFIVDTLL